MDYRFWKSSKKSSILCIPGRVFVEPNKKISMAEICKYSETLYKKFWVFKNVFLLKEYLVYVESKENGKKVVATLSSEVVENAISTIRERKRREFEKRKDLERKKITQLLQQTEVENQKITELLEQQDKERKHILEVLKKLQDQKSGMN